MIRSLGRSGNESKITLYGHIILDFASLGKEKWYPKNVLQGPLVLWNMVILSWTCGGEGDDEYLRTML